MNRTTKALARLGTLAIIAGTALGTPLAIGSANALVTTDITVTYGSIGSVENAASQNDYNNSGNIEIANIPAGHTVVVQLNSGSGYFPLLTQQGDADVTGITAKKATCFNAAAYTCDIVVGDPAAEDVNFSVVDSVDLSSVFRKISFNGLFLSGCPGSGLDTGLTGGVLWDDAAAEEDQTDQNCVTQGQFGSGTPVVITAHYGASDPVNANQTQQLGILLNPLGDNAILSNTQPSNVQRLTNFTATCNTDASGNCAINVINQGNGVNPIPQNYTEQSLIEVNTLSSTGLYPTIPLHTTTDSTPSSVAPVELINWHVGAVAAARLNLIDSQVLAPDTQAATGATNAEPGDAVELTYQLTGSCAVVDTVGFETCAGDPLSGVSATLAVDHGFFTPNCISGPVHEYAGCSFTTAPAHGVAAGNLTSSGASTTVQTGVDGTFVVTLGIGKDAAFDQDGLLNVHVTSGALKSVRLGATPPPADERAKGNGCTATPSPTNVPGTLTPTNGLDLSGQDNCPIDLQWTTREAPLNGGTAKLIAIPEIAQPNNTAIQTENNFDKEPMDSGTVNVPDVERVSFLVHETDQFGNLTSGTETSPAVLADSPTLTKTGPGWIRTCTGKSTTSACTGGSSSAFTATAQPNGTQTQVNTGVVGSYTTDVYDGGVNGAVGGQLRYQVDTNPTGSGANTGYPCSTAFATCDPTVNPATPGVNDGTTVVTLSWAAPTTTFDTFVAGSPAAAQYAAGTGTAATDVYTLNFYNQLAQPVVTFTVKPGTTVPTGTAVTVQATVLDQFQNPIVNQLIDAVRSGANESSCTPTQNVGNGGNVENPLRTNTSGIAGYTFTCDAPGASSVSMVVVGPGGTQLATGRETVHFTGQAVKVKKELPSIKSIKSNKAGHFVIHIRTHPALAKVRVNIYKKSNGLYHKIGSVKTGAKGHAVKHLGGLVHGRTYHISVKAIGLGVGYNSHYSHHKNVRV